VTDPLLLNLQSLARIGALLNSAEFLFHLAVVFFLLGFAFAARQAASYCRQRWHEAEAAQLHRRLYARQCEADDISDELLDYMAGEDEEAGHLCGRSADCGCEPCETKRHHATISTCVVVQRGEALT
jgi:hypothetical protein